MTKQYAFLVFLLIFIEYSEPITVMSVDLGSQWMKIAIVKPGVPMEIVLNKETKRKTEVAVAIKDGERLFGSSAVSQGVRFPKTTYLYLLDLLAKRIDNPIVQLYKERFPYYDLTEDPTTGYVKFVHDKENDISYSPEELLAMVLNYSRSLAEEFAEQSVDTCIVTVPPFFNQAERLQLQYAIRLAGLKGAQILDDNVASSLNYGVFRRHDINATATHIMFYDMGATSTTATIVDYQVVKVGGDADPQLAIKGVGFDRSLGGLEFELRLREHLIKLFNENKKTKSDVRKSPRAMAKLLKEAGRLKKVLSANVAHQARIEGLIDEEDFVAKVTREEFEELCSDLFSRVGQPMKTALDSAGLPMESISKIILVGGGTRVPKVQEILLKESGKSDLGRSLNTDEAPALGASYEAAARSNAFRVKTFHVKLGTVYPIDIEFDRVTEQEDGMQHIKHVRKTLFQRNNPYPQRKVITFNRFYSDFSFDVNYGDLKFLTKDQSEVFGKRNISIVKLQGVDLAHEKHGKDNTTESKGVKAHFRMDENGILMLEEVESVYESNDTKVENATAEETVDPSTFQKLKDSFSNLFGGADDEGKDVDGGSDKEPNDEEKGKENKEASQGQEKSEEEKKQEEDSKEKGESGSEKDETEKAEAEKESTEGKSDKEEKKDIPKSENGNKTENATKQSEVVKKVQKIKLSVSLNKTVARLDFVENSEKSFNASSAMLKVLAERDALKIAREEAMNNLESYIYEKQDKLYQDEYKNAMTSQEEEDIEKALREASDWMFDLEEDQAPEVYKDKLKDLRKLARPWLLRVKERQEFPQLFKDMEMMFNYTAHFVAAIDSLAEDDQIYTEVEIGLLKKTFNDTVNWKNETVKQQEALEPSADNILKPDDIKMKIGELNREVQYLLNKAKTAKPKKKPESKSNSTKTEGNDGGNNTDSTITDDDKGKAEEEKTDEKVEKTNDEVKEASKEDTKDDQNKETTEGEEQTEPTLELPPPDDDVTPTTESEPSLPPPTIETSTESKHEEPEKEEL